MHNPTIRVDAVHPWDELRPIPVLRRLAKGALEAADAVCTALSPAAVRNAPGLIVLGLHSLCADHTGLCDPLLAPGQSVCVSDLRELVEHVLEAGFAIVSPAQVDAGLPDRGRYVMLTFDDGYHNNVLALDVLDEFKVPATFFISSTSVLEGKAFWWNALNRELMRAGVSPQACRQQTERLKKWSAAGIEATLRMRFGPDVLRPRGDSDRPFSAAELADFARHPWVDIGNHTADHAILTRYTPQEMRTQIDSCQDALRSITGRTPLAIAYPNGNHSPAVLEAARAAGLRVGVTVRPAKNKLPQPGTMAVMRLGRFYFHGRPDAAREFQALRCGFLPSRIARFMLQRD